jgi:desulfoferrodoxin (superoxide reductase-like protein)
MKYLCVNCNYLYDTALWDKEENVEIWVELNKCPVCEEFDVFQWIEEEVNYINDNNLYWLEIDHYPEVRIENDKIYVTVGNEIHPMWEWHRIAAVYLYDEYWDLIEVKYLEMNTEAVIDFDFYSLDEFEIRVQCSLHWLWGKKFIN